MKKTKHEKLYDKVATHCAYEGNYIGYTALGTTRKTIYLKSKKQREICKKEGWEDREDFMIGSDVIILSVSGGGYGGTIYEVVTDVDMFDSVKEYIDHTTSCYPNSGRNELLDLIIEQDMEFGGYVEISFSKVIPPKAKIGEL